MLYLISNGQTTELQSPFTTDGIVVFQSATLNMDPSATGTTALDNTAFNLLDKNSNILLHISVRRGGNVIIFNTMQAGGGWGPEEKITLADKFVGPKNTSTTITVYDHGDRFQILIDYHTVHYYTKRIKGDAARIAYGMNEGQNSPFSNPIAVSTYSSLGGIAARDD